MKTITLTLLVLLPLVIFAQVPQNDSVKAQELTASPMDHSAQHSQEMNIKVIEKESFEPVPFATIVVEYAIVL